MLLLAITHRNGVRIAEIGFVLIILAGVWLAALELPQFRDRPARTGVAGLALAIAGVLLIIATHWGHVS